MNKEPCQAQVVSNLLKKKRVNGLATVAVARLLPGRSLGLATIQAAVRAVPYAGLGVEGVVGTMSVAVRCGPVRVTCGGSVLCIAVRRRSCLVVRHAHAVHALPAGPVLLGDVGERSVRESENPDQPEYGDDHSDLCRCLHLFHQLNTRAD